MRNLFFLLLLGSGALVAQVPQINGATVKADHIGHATAHVTYQLAGGSTTPVQGRIRWIQSPGTCTGGSGGTLMLNPILQGADSWWRIAIGSHSVYSMPLHGLSPNTTYQVCPELTSDNTSWSSGVGISLTTEATPAVHPALPIAPQRFDTNYPDTTGYLTVNLANNDDCTGLENAYNWAINDPGLSLAGDTSACHDQKCRGVVISLAAGSACVGRVYTRTVPPDAVNLSANTATFNTSTFIITTSSPVSEGQALAFSTTNSEVMGGGYAPGVMPGATTNGVNGSATGGLDGQGFADDHLPFFTNSVVYAHITCSGCDATHFQVYANAPFSAGLCPAGQSTSYSDNGNIYISGRACPILWQFDSVGAGSILYAPLVQDSLGGWKRNLKWVIVRTATPDAQFVPEHVRLQGPIDPAGETPAAPTIWQPKMAALQLPWAYLGSLQGGANMLFTIGWAKNAEASDYYFGANVRFVGVEFTYQPYPQAASMIDMPPGQILINLGQDSSNIIFDRCWIHGWPPPFRSYHALNWNGRNNAFIDSFINDFHFPRQFNFGLRVH